MVWSQVLHSVFGFRANAVTTFLILVYFVVFVGVIVSDPVPHAPRNTGELDLEQAYRDLHQIAARPRPFISHANDDVRAYILSRLQNITQNVPHVHVVEDINSNATWVEGNAAISFEGLNVLVKIDGTDSGFAEKGGVLFSAHYDSVSTGLGATDDAIGVVTLIAMVEYLATKVRTKRTAIFNINDGEEDGLHGAHLLLEHPWSKIPDTFINLEGAGAGGFVYSHKRQTEVGTHHRGYIRLYSGFKIVYILGTLRRFCLSYRTSASIGLGRRLLI